MLLLLQEVILSATCTLEDGGRILERNINENFFVHRVTAFIQCVSKRLLQLQGEIYSH